MKQLWRCRVIFPDKIWVSLSASAPFVISIGEYHRADPENTPNLNPGSAIAGAISLVIPHQHNGPTRSELDIFVLTGSHDDRLATIRNISSMVSMASSVLVNVLVTSCILVRIYHGRREAKLLTHSIGQDLEQLVQGENLTLEKTEGLSNEKMQGCTPDYHSTASILLMETALPSAISGILACLVQPLCAFDMCTSDIAAARYTIRILWLWFTVGISLKHSIVHPR